MSATTEPMGGWVRGRKRAGPPPAAENILVNVAHIVSLQDGPEGGPIARLSDGRVVVLDEWQALPNAEANAALIVHRVNTWESLRDALILAEDALERAAPGHRVLDKIRAALSKAEEGPENSTEGSSPFGGGLIFVCVVCGATATHYIDRPLGGHAMADCFCAEHAPEGAAHPFPSDAPGLPEQGIGQSG